MSFNPEGNKVPIRLLNLSPDKVKICTGTTVVSIECVEDDLQDKVVAVSTDSDNSLPSLAPARASML